MHRLSVLHTTLLALIAVLYLYFGLHERFLFTVFGWDILLHVLGGAWVALAATWFFTLFHVRLGPWQLIAGVVFVGMAWEVFEYVYGIAGSIFLSHQADTIKDLIVDTIGGFAALQVLKRI